jgi:hypothetical protein
MSMVRKKSRLPLVLLTLVLGDMVYFHGFGNSILVLNNYNTMIDLLVKKGNQYCSRPYFIVACELMDLINVSY